MRYLSVCSGMEAASVAWHPLGWQPVAFSEIEKYACAILAHRFPNIPNYGSLTEYQSWPLEPGAIDLLVGGTPCQSYSVAGKRGGLNDPRGQLMLSFLDLAQRLKVRWVLWENVPGVLSSGQPRGSDFATFLQGLVERGYGWAYRVLDAQHVGRCRMHAQGSGWDAVPQRRRRVFVVACLGAGGWESAAKVLFEPESLCWDTAKGRKKGKDVATDAQSGLRAGQQLIGGIDYEHNPHGPNDVTGPLLKGSPTGGGHPLPAIAYRKSKRASSTTDNESWVPADASNTLNNFDLGDTRTTHAVVQPVAWTQNQREEVRLLGDKVGAIALHGTHQTNYIAEPIHQMPGNIAPTIGASGPPYSRTGNERVEAEALAVTFQPGNLCRQAGADPSTTTTTTLKASSGDQMPHIATAMAVRRLTPNECMRLQGFPDNWANIPWKGKPEGQAPDSPQYRAAGNSMAVPVMRWIGERIAAVDAKYFSNA